MMSMMPITAALVLTAGALVTTAASAYHPEPRVIVTVTALRGGHDREEVQRSARESWGGIVRCYKQLGKGERGTLTVRLEIAAQGKVVSARRVESTLNDDVCACLTGVLRDRTMPSGQSGSTATISVELAPGDK